MARVVVSLLAACDQAGLIDVSITATDSTPMAAPAALGKTLTPPRIPVLIEPAEQELAALPTGITDLARADPAAFVASGATLPAAEQLLLVRLARLRAAETRARERAADLAKPGSRDRRSRILTWQSRVDKRTAELAAMTERQQQAVSEYQTKVDAGHKPPGPAPRPP